MTTSDESALSGLLQQMIEDIKGANCYYWLYSNYFDILPPTDRTVTQWWQAPLFFDDDALWNPAFENDAILIDVILRNELPAVHERIRIKYSQIWSLKRFYKEQNAGSDADWLLYNDSAKLRMPPIYNED
ncbi:hypothetical protein A6C57_27925 (plasmid) [Fibrella sp. ES10-3-2-2]